MGSVAVALAVGVFWWSRFSWWCPFGFWGLERVKMEGLGHEIPASFGLGIFIEDGTRNARDFGSIER